MATKISRQSFKLRKHPPCTTQYFMIIFTTRIEDIINIRSKGDEEQWSV